MITVCVFFDLSAEKVTAFSTLLIAIATFVVGIPAYWQYKKNTEIRNTELLISLYHKFFENKGDLKVVRKWIDSVPVKNKENFEKVKRDDETFEEKFTDYLNFFQLMVVLKNSGQIQENEIRQMFHYYLKLIKQSDFIMAYLKTYDYKVLEEFLKKYQV